MPGCSRTRCMKAAGWRSGPDRKATCEASRQEGYPSSLNPTRSCRSSRSLTTRCSWRSRSLPKAGHTGCPVFSPFRSGAAFWRSWNGSLAGTSHSSTASMPSRSRSHVRQGRCAFRCHREAGILSGSSSHSTRTFNSALTNGRRLSPAGSIAFSASGLARDSWRIRWKAREKRL